MAFAAKDSYVLNYSSLMPSGVNGSFKWVFVAPVRHSFCMPVIQNPKEEKSSMLHSRDRSLKNYVDR